MDKISIFCKISKFCNFFTNHFLKIPHVVTLIFCHVMPYKLCTICIFFPLGVTFFIFFSWKTVDCNSIVSLQKFGIRIHIKFMIFRENHVFFFRFWLLTYDFFEIKKKMLLFDSMKTFGNIKILLLFFTI